MATKKTNTRTASSKKTTSTRSRSRSQAKTTSVAPQTAATPTTTPAFSVPKLSTNFLLGFAIVVLSGIALFLVAQRYRGLLIAGTVNKTPITRWELNKVLTNRYGDAVLEELVNNELLTQEAAKQGITITDEDLANERQSLVDSLGGEENLASALTQYGLSEADLSDQLRLKLTQDRLSDKLFDVNITDEEIAEYFEANQAMYEGVELDQVREEIKQGLTQQQLQQEFYAWFDQLKSEAQIETYIN